MKKVKDGWHKVYEYDVWVENGWATRARSSDGQRPLHIYKVAKDGGYNLWGAVKYGELRSRVSCGTMVIK